MKTATTIWILLVAAGCVATGGVSGDDDDVVIGGDSDADADADADTDTDSGTGTGTGTGTATGEGSTGEGVDPSGGSGGDVPAGGSGETDSGVPFYVPASYAPDEVASPLLWLWNESFDDWRVVADENGILLADVTSWVGDGALGDALDESAAFLGAGYNVDRGRYFWAGWSGGGNAVIQNGSLNQAFLAGVMVFPGTGGDHAATNLADWDGHKMRLFYACGDEDPIYPWDGVQAEADAWTKRYGYETRFERAPGAGHYIDEATFGIRRTAWDWIGGFTLEN